MKREIKKIVTGKKAIDGAGVHLTRVVGYNDVKDFDPFLMLDGFDSNNPDDYIQGFPWHPHRGIETVTYLIEGKIEHGDTIGSKGVIKSGCCQWMTAGNGIIHQEMPKPDEKVNNKMLGTQLWINLPKKDKMANPQYRDITASDIKCINEDNGVVRVVSGEYKGEKGFFKGDYVETLFLDIQLKENGVFNVEIEKENTVFVYIVHGSAAFGSKLDSAVAEKSAVLLDNSSNEVQIKAINKPARLLLYSGKPLKEPIAWGGPIVMNTQQELNFAFEELNRGTFIKSTKNSFNNINRDFYSDT